MTEIITLTPQLFVLQSRSMAYNSGALISDGHACLIDPGPHPDEVEQLLLFVAGKRAVIDSVILTHSHWDHILGPDRMRPELIITTEAYRRVSAVDREVILKAVARWEQRSGYARERPFVIPQPNATFEEAIELRLGNLELKLLAIAGHAADQLAVYEPRSGLLWAADMLSDREIPFVADCLSAYEGSLARLARLDIRVLVPGHGCPTSDQEEIAARLAADKAYLAELRRRVGDAIRLGLSLEATRVQCENMAFHHQEENRSPHRLNVESAYIELGGAADPDLVGWRQKGLIDE